MENNKFPRVVRAAITASNPILVCSLPPPANHLDVYAYMIEAGYGPLSGLEVEGFLLENGYFAGRAFAQECAIRNSQILPDQIDKLDKVFLYCENVW